MEQRRPLHVEVGMLLEALIVLLGIVAFDLAAVRWGVDSRDGNDWHQHPRP